MEAGHGWVSLSLPKWSWPAGRWRPGSQPFRRDQGCPSRVARAAQLSAAARTTSQGWKTPPALSSPGSSGRDLETPTRGQFRELPELTSFPSRQAVLALTLKS